MRDVGIVHPRIETVLKKNISNTRLFKYGIYIFNGPVHEISTLIISASSEGSGKSVQSHRLARAFAAHTHKVWM